MSKDNKNIGFAIKKVDEESYWDYNNDEFTSRYEIENKYLAKLFDTIDEAEDYILDNELDNDDELEIVKIEKQFITLERYKRIKKVEHELID